MKSNYVKCLVESAGVFNMESIAADQDGNFPQGEIITKGGYSYLLDDKGLTDDEVNTALLALQTKHLETIKNIVLTYFILSLIVGLIIAFNILIR